MNANLHADQTNGERLLIWYNVIPNVFWSALCITPVAVFCYNVIPSGYLYSFAGVSAIPLFFPSAFLAYLQVSKNITFYTKTGVTYIQRFTQNGAIVNKLVRRKFPEYKVYRRSKTKGFQTQQAMFQKFHFALFMFFLIVSVYAFAFSFIEWAVVILISNIMYNVYPILLQQYIVLRLAKHT